MKMAKTARLANKRFDFKVASFLGYVFGNLELVDIHFRVLGKSFTIVTRPLGLIGITSLPREKAGVWLIHLDCVNQVCQVCTVGNLIDVSLFTRVLPIAAWQPWAAGLRLTQSISYILYLCRATWSAINQPHFHSNQFKVAKYASQESGHLDLTRWEGCQNTVLATFFGSLEPCEFLIGGHLNAHN